MKVKKSTSYSPDSKIHVTIAFYNLNEDFVVNIGSSRSNKNDVYQVGKWHLKHKKII